MSENVTGTGHQLFLRRSPIFILRSCFNTYNGAGGASCTSLASLTGLALSGGTPEPGFTPNAEVRVTDLLH